MSQIQLLQWALWGTALVAGVIVVVKLARLLDLQKLIPTWQQAEDAKARLPVLQEEHRQKIEDIEKCRGEIGRLEAEVGALRILKAWNEANPSAAEEIAAKRRALEDLKVDLCDLQWFSVSSIRNVQLHDQQVCGFSDGLNHLVSISAGGDNFMASDQSRLSNVQPHPATGTGDKPHLLDCHRYFSVLFAQLWSEFTKPISRRYSAVHEEVAASDERAVRTHEECAHGSYLVGGASTSRRA